MTCRPRLLSIACLALAAAVASAAPAPATPAAAPADAVLELLQQRGLLPTRAHQEAGDVVRAAESYRTALRHEPRNAMCYNNLGVALFDLGEFLAAKNALVRAGELDPSLVRAKLNLAIWHRKHKDMAVAR